LDHSKVSLLSPPNCVANNLKWCLARFPLIYDLLEWKRDLARVDKCGRWCSSFVWWHCVGEDRVEWNRREPLLCPFRAGLIGQSLGNLVQLSGIKKSFERVWDIHRNGWYDFGGKERSYGSRDGVGWRIFVSQLLYEWDLHDGGPKGDSGKIEFLKLSSATKVVFWNEFGMYHIHSFSAYPQRKSLNATVWNVFSEYSTTSSWLCVARPAL